MAMKILTTHDVVNSVEILPTSKRLPTQLLDICEDCKSFDPVLAKEYFYNGDVAIPVFHLTCENYETCKRLLPVVERQIRRG